MEDFYIFLFIVTRAARGRNKNLREKIKMPANCCFVKGMIGRIAV